MNNSIREEIKEIAVPLVLYIIIVILLMRDIFTKIYIIPTGDSYFSFYSWNAFFRNCLEKGIFPLWNPLVLCGHPYHLESVSNFSFSNILLFLFDVNFAWNVKFFFSNVLSAFFMFLVLKKAISVSGVSAFLGGVIFMLISVDITDKPYFYMPIIFILANNWISSKKFIWASLLSLSIFLYFLNSNPQYVLYFCIFIFLFIIIGLFRNSKNKGIANALFLLLMSSLPFVIAFGLASFRIVPMIEMASLSHRWSMASIITSVFPTHLIQLLYPKFYMTSLPNELNFLFDRALLGLAAFLLPGKNINFANAPYIGAGPFILAALFFFKKEKSYHERFFFYSSLSVLLYVIFNPILYPVFKYLPLLNKMPFVERGYIVYHFSMVILAALALDKILAKDSLFLKAVQKMAFILTALVSSIALLKAAIFILLKIYGQQIESALLNLLPKIVYNHAVYQAGQGFYQERIHQAMFFLNSWVSFSNSFFLVPTVVILVSLAVIYAYSKAKVSKFIFLCLFSFITLIDLGMSFKITAFYPKDLRPYSKISDFIAHQPGVFRVMPLHKYNAENPLPMNVQTFLRPESQLLYNIPTPEGYRSLILERYIDVLGLLVGQPSEGLRAKVGEFERINKNIADFLNIKYVVTSSTNSLGYGYKLIYSDKAHNLFENQGVLERAFLVHKAEFVKDKEELLTKMKNGFDFKNNVLLEEAFPALNARGDSLIRQSQVSMDKYEPNHIRVSLSNPKDGYLVLSDCYYPGWQVYIDGKRKKVLLANYAFRAVRVSPGVHIVEFKYNPSSFKLGLGLSFLFLLFGFVLFKLLSGFGR